MAISNATRLSDFGSGIGTQGAVIQVDNTNARLGVGTTSPQAMLQVGTGVSVYGDSGIVSATTYYGDGSKLTGVAATDNINTNNIAISGIATVGTSITMRDGAINVTGVITATSFKGDGSLLSGVSGFGSAFDSTSGTLGNLIYETPRSFYQTGITSAYVVAEASSGGIAFTRLAEIRLGVGATMHIGAGTTLIMNVLNLF